MTKSFLITGVSGGLGRALALRALAAGHTVAGTLRDPAQVAGFEALAPGRAHGVLLDVTDTDAIPGAVAAATAALGGGIDVLVNNAGYGLEGVFEEVGDAELRHQFDVNVFGAAAVTRAVLPGMRERRSGHVVFITSMGGLFAFPGLSAYHAAKYAVEGLSASLRREVGPLGVHVTAVEPGAFRTDWAGRSMRRVERSIADYDEVFDPVRRARAERSGNQPGDPDRAGDAILALVEAPEPPGHLLLGTDALGLVAQARAAFDAETEAWRAVSEGTDFPQA